MRILVTGAAGFVGGYLVWELTRHGHAVVGVDNLSREPGQTFPMDAGCESLVGDARDSELLKSALRGCDALVLLAANVGGVGYLSSRRFDLFLDNARLTSAGLEAAVWAYANDCLRRVCIVSSSHVYGDTGSEPAREGDELRRTPPTGYGLQKLAAEFMARDAFHQHGLPYTIVRPFNCVGPRRAEARKTRGRPVPDSPGVHHVVPDLIRKAIAGGPLGLLGDGQQTRNYVHARDVARGMRLCLESPEAENEDFNLTTGRKTTVIGLAKLVWHQLNERPFECVLTPGAGTDLQINVGDGTKAERRLGFQCGTTLEAAIAEIVAEERQGHSVS